MCLAPSVPKITTPPALQPALSPYGGANGAGANAAAQSRARIGLAATIMTPPGGPAAAPTATKTLLGS